ncbi:MAG TPA: PAS domain S-box protein [Anaerolineales bacterium]|nr:PAS domain S-box protein [Anaerolineales bacterium]
MRLARRHPEFKTILPHSASGPPADDEAQRRAIFHGEWQPYIRSLQTRGIQYAQAGLSFLAWFEIAGAFRKYMLPHLLEAYGGSPGRLGAALSGMEGLFDLQLHVIGESYLETQGELIRQQRQRVQQSQSQLAGIINSAMDAIITMDEDQRILIFNPAAEKMFQRFADKVIGKPLAMLIPERLRTQHEEDVRSFGRTSITKRSMGRLGLVFGLRANGEEFPLEVSISQMETDGRKTFTAILRDSTERRQAEDRLRYLGSIVESAMDAIIGKTLDGTIVSWNPGAERIYGYQAREVIGKPISIISPPEGPDDMRAILEKIKGGERIQQYETVRLARDGSRIDVSLNVSPLRDDAGNIVGATAIFRDITERKQAERALRRAHDDLELQVQERTAALSESNMLLKMLLDYSPDHIFFKDLQSRFIRTSRSQAQALGLGDPAEIAGKSDFDFFAHAQRSYEIEQEIIRSGEPSIGLEEHVVWPDGGESWGLTTKVPLRDADDNIIGTFGIFKDITQRKQAEEALQKAELDLEATNRELEAFSYSVSHDLRAPLRSIDGFSQALLEDYADQLPPEGRHYLQRVRAAAQHMAELIDDLLNLARVTRASLQPGSVDLSAIARQIAGELSELHPERNVKFDIAPEVHCSGDARLLQIVMENLLNNAWKFTSRRAEAHIEFNVLNENGSRTFFVRDNGAGFDMKYADKLFGAFQRLHSASEFPGTGIGLATIQRIIHKHGGRIWAEGAVDRGATFYFSL